jgi:hypothetical protein
MYRQYLSWPDGAIAAGIQRLSDGAFIPDDPKNADWRAYQAWVDLGNTPLPPPEE